MPWVIREKDGKHCLYKKGSDGEPTGETLGCHPSHDEAVAQMRALYANEPGAKAVKAVDSSEDEIEGIGMPWGGPINGRDVQGEYFSARTEFAFDWFPERPLLYHHGLDQPGLEVVGRVKSWEPTDLGIWVKAQLNKKSKYFEAVKQLIDQQALYFSSGAMAHLAKVEKSGEIKQWPWVELTLTPTPANTLATLDYATAKAHLKAIDLDLPAGVEPEPVPEIKALAGSYESLLERLTAAINPHNPFASPDRYAYVVATYADHIKAYLYENGEGSIYDVDYRLDGQGNVTIGQINPAEGDGHKAIATPDQLTYHAQLIASLSTALAQRTKDLSERRIKEGRVLSTATRTRLAECLTTMAAAIDALQNLLDSADPAKAEAKAEFGRLLAEFETLELETALV